MLREIVFDVETTGLSYDSGDKLVEIGAVELINHMPTGKFYHQYINPERDVPEGAVKVHGLTAEFLQNYPKVSEIAQDFLDFVGDDSVLVAHNATFDFNFVNYELKRKGFKLFTWDRVVDTLEIARNKFPGSRNSLDALCKRFNIDNASRVKHGALLDSELLAEVYLELLGGAEPTMELKQEHVKTITTQDIELERTYRAPRNFLLTDEENNLHEEFLKSQIKDALWLKQS